MKHPGSSCKKLSSWRKMFWCRNLCDILSYKWYEVQMFINLWIS